MPKITKYLTERQRLARVEGAITALAEIGKQHADALAYTVGAQDGEDYQTALRRLIREEVQAALAEVRA